MTLCLGNDSMYSTAGGLPRGLGRSALIAAVAMGVLAVAWRLVDHPVLGAYAWPLAPLVGFPLFLAPVLVVAWLSLSIAAGITGLLCLYLARDRSGKHAVIGILWAAASWLVTCEVTLPVVRGDVF